MKTGSVSVSTMISPVWRGDRVCGWTWTWASKARGTGGGRPYTMSINQRGRPPRTEDRYLFQYFLYVLKVCIFNIFNPKWPRSEEKLTFGGRWVWEPMNPSPNQNFMAGGTSHTCHKAFSIHDRVTVAAKPLETIIFRDIF